MVSLHDGLSTVLSTEKLCRLWSAWSFLVAGKLHKLNKSAAIIATARNKNKGQKNRSHNKHKWIAFGFPPNIVYTDNVETDEFMS